MSTARSLQERFAPNNDCFGCGVANPHGLRLSSFPRLEEGDELVARWTPLAHHRAFGAVLNGGICGALLDCHSNWAAAWHLLRQDPSGTLPPTVTADFHVRLKRPTPLGQELLLHAVAVASAAEKVTVEATIEAAGKITATCLGHFIAVQPGHPAYHRW